MKKTNERKPPTVLKDFSQNAVKFEEAIVLNAV